MSTEAELILFFVTAGRGTENFAANEITDKLISSNVSIRDGKVFFKLSSASGLNIQRILALRSVERLFVAVTDYDNVNYIQTKRTFLDKLMSTLSQTEIFVNAKVVLEQLTLLKNRNKIENEAVLNYGCKSPQVETGIVPNGHSLLDQASAEIPAAVNSVCKQGGLHGSYVLSVEPAEKYRKLDITCSTSEIVSEHTPEANLPDFSSSHSKQTALNCKAFVDNNHGLSCGATLGQVCHSECAPESDKNISDERGVSFRMSIKCSGRVSKWINLKKLSKDLGWRVAKATGWRVELRNPQFDVCLHISDEHVTVGVPLTRFPLSKRVYMVDQGLRAPVGWIMSQLGSIKPGDVVLDPMCGKATVLIEASSDVTDAWFMGSDLDLSQIDKALQNVNTCNHWNTTSLLIADGLNLPFRDSCVDVVLCDAPFNQNHLFELTSQEFYCKFIKEMSRVLRPGGRFVLLVSEQLKHMVLVMVQGSENVTGATLTEGSPTQENKSPEQHEMTTAAMVPLTFVSSHYMKLGETHACIIVLQKFLD